MLGERLKQARIDRNMKQYEIAKELNITNAAYSQYESDKRQPDYDTLVQIADILDVSTDYLLGRTDKKEIKVVQYDDMAIHQEKDSLPLTDDQLKFLKDLIKKEIEEDKEKES